MCFRVIIWAKTNRRRRQCPTEALALGKLFEWTGRDGCGFCFALTPERVWFPGESGWKRKPAGSERAPPAESTGLDSTAFGIGRPFSPSRSKPRGSTLFEKFWSPIYTGNHAPGPAPGSPGGCTFPKRWANDSPNRSRHDSLSAADAGAVWEPISQTSPRLSEHRLLPPAGRHRR